MRISDWISDVCLPIFYHLLFGVVSGLFNVISGFFSALWCGQNTSHKSCNGPSCSTNCCSKCNFSSSCHNYFPFLELVVTFLTIRPMISATNRSDERRGGKEWVCTLRSRWAPNN